MFICVWAYVLVSSSDRMSEGVGSSGAEVLGSGEMRYMGTGNQTQVF